jgi:hypothetical protein
MIKKLAILLMLVTPALAQSSLERCQAGSCFGFGPPVGPSQSGLIYQDVSTSPPTLYCGKNSTWVACGGTGGSFTPPTGTGFFHITGGTTDPASTLDGSTLTNLNASNIASGTLSGGRLPNPSSSTLGGTQSYAAVANQFLDSISTSGVPHSRIIAAGDLPISTTGAFGAVKPDGTTITIASGVITAVATGSIPSTTAMLKGNGSGGASAATLGTDYYGPDTVNNGQVAYTCGSGGNSTRPTPTAGIDATAYNCTTNLISRSVNGGAYVDIPAPVANVVVAMPTSSISGNACTSAATASMPGLATTSGFVTAFASDASAVNGWGATGGLTFVAWPTANTLNWKVCNQTGSAITPGAMSLNVGAK